MRNRALPFNYVGANIAPRYIGCLSFRGPIDISRCFGSLWKLSFCVVSITNLIRDGGFLGNLKKMEIEDIYIHSDFLRGNGDADYLLVTMILIMELLFERIVLINSILFYDRAK